MLKVGFVVVLHATDFGSKHTPKHILHHIGVVASAASLGCKENCRLYPLGVEGAIHAVVHLHHAAEIEERKLDGQGHYENNSNKTTTTTTATTKWECHLGARDYQTNKKLEGNYLFTGGVSL